MRSSLLDIFTDESLPQEQSWILVLYVRAVQYMNMGPESRVSMPLSVQLYGAAHL